MHVALGLMGLPGALVLALVTVDLLRLLPLALALALASRIALLAATAALAVFHLRLLTKGMLQKRAHLRGTVIDARCFWIGAGLPR
jgi:hypothetical protein